MSGSTPKSPISTRRLWATALALTAAVLAAGSAIRLSTPTPQSPVAGPESRPGLPGPGADAAAPSEARPRELPASAGQALTPAASPSTDTPPPPPPRPDLAAVTALARAAEASRTARAVGVAVYDLRHDQAYGVRPNRLFKPASVIKLAIMVGAFQAREEGAIPAARFERLRPSLRRMITVSDNPSATFLVHAVGRERVNRAMAQLGLAHTHLSFRPQRGGVLVGSTTTPSEIARLLAKLARREVVSPRASNEMLLLLGASQRRKRIPAGLPPHPGLWVGNKTGTLAGLVHDSAIVLDSAAGVGYTLAIFTEGARSEAAANRLCTALSRAVYAALRRPPASGIAAHSATSPSGAPPGSPSR